MIEFEVGVQCIMWLFLYLLSPTFAVITMLKRGKSEAAKTRLLRRWSSGAAALTLLAMASVLVAEQFVTVDRWPVMILALIAFWRVNEIVFAFFKDALSRLGRELQTTTFTPAERLKFVAISYLELITCFGFIYLGIQSFYLFMEPSSVAFKGGLPGIADAVFLSSTVITTLGYGEKDPVAWVAKILSIWEVFSGFILFAMALAVYLGSEQTTTINNTSAPVSKAQPGGTAPP